MKRKITVLSLCLAIIMLFAACGQTSTQTFAVKSGDAFAAAAPTEAETLRIVQFNVKNCNKGADIDGIAAEIKEQSPDVVFLQELDWDVPRSDNKEVLKLLAEELKMNYAFFSAIQLDGGEYGVGILSAYPFSETESYPLPVKKGDEGRVLARAQIIVNGEKINLFNTHLSFENTNKRLEQLEFVSEKISGSEKFILCGDFNAESYSEYEKLQNATLVNNTETNYMTFAGDDEPDGYFRGIDNIVLSKNFEVLNSKMVETKISDHNMLVAEIKL